MEMEKQPKPPKPTYPMKRSTPIRALTVTFLEKDQENILKLKEYTGVSAITEIIRFSLKRAVESIEFEKKAMEILLYQNPKKSQKKFMEEALSSERPHEQKKQELESL